MEEHSKKKLTLYREYLDGYLSVLTNQSYFKNIFIVDFFGGVGINQNGDQGSAIIAAEAVKQFQEESNPDIRLILNELDNRKYNRLKENIIPILPTCCISNKPANDLLPRLYAEYQKFKSRSRTLIFIDPYGYTQFGQNNLTQLMQDTSIEILIFIPINHIYRFINRQDPEISVRPIRHFLSDCGIGPEQYKGLDNLDDFISLLKANFKERSKNPSYIYSYRLKNERPGVTNSWHCLFFITHHERGADKFLEAMYKIRKNNQEALLFDFDVTDTLQKLVPYLHEYRSNLDINEWRRENGYHTTDITDALRNLESNDKLEIEEIQKRNRKGFYLNNLDKKLSIRIKKS